MSDLPGGMGQLFRRMIDWLPPEGQRHTYHFLTSIVVGFACWIMVSLIGIELISSLLAGMIAGVACYAALRRWDRGGS